MIDRIVLHGTPGDEPGSQRLHPVRHPYVGEPRPTFDLPMRRIEGMAIRDECVTYFYVGVGQDGLPHYSTRAAMQAAKAAL